MLSPSSPQVALDIYTKLGKYPNALRVAMRLNDHSLINKVFELCEDELVKKQLGFMLARQRFLINVQDEELNDIISNSRLSEYFHKVAEELEATDAKTPEDVYKTHLTETRASPARPSILMISLLSITSLPSSFLGGKVEGENMFCPRAVYVLITLHCCSM